MGAGLNFVTFNEDFKRPGNPKVARLDEEWIVQMQTVKLYLSFYPSIFFLRFPSSSSLIAQIWCLQKKLVMAFSVDSHSPKQYRIFQTGTWENKGLNQLAHKALQDFSLLFFYGRKFSFTATRMSADSNLYPTICLPNSSVCLSFHFPSKRQWKRR